MSYRVIYIESNEPSLLQKRREFDELSEAIGFAKGYEDSIVKHLCQEEDLEAGKCKVCNSYLTI